MRYEHRFLCTLPDETKVCNAKVMCSLFTLLIYFSFNYFCQNNDPARKKSAEIQNH
jgi:hypothetical protein